MNTYNTNIYPSDIQKHYFKSSDRNIISSLKIKADNTCRNLINPDYIHKAFNRFKSGYYYTSIQNEVLGFVLWKEINIVQENKSEIKNDKIEDEEFTYATGHFVSVFRKDNGDNRLIVNGWFIPKKNIMMCIAS